MKKEIKYAGLKGSYEFVEDENIFYGKLTNVDGLITFQSETEEGVKPAFIEAVNDYRSLCDELDKSVISCREEYEKYVNELENGTQEDDEEIELLLSFIVDYEFQNSIDRVIL